MDSKSRIRGGVEAWRKSFPYARAVNVSRRNDIIDADFVHIRGDARVRLHTVSMAQCSSVTNEAFEHLRGIHTLDMAVCYQDTITDAAFVHLSGLNVMLCREVCVTCITHSYGTHGATRITRRVMWPSWQGVNNTNTNVILLLPTTSTAHTTYTLLFSFFL